jgi:PilZ domain
MSEPCTVIIGAPSLLDALRQRVGAEGEVLTFGDNEALRALETITTRRPNVITFERLFAATSRGAALINRIKADPALQHVEIRVVSHDGSHSRVSPRRGKSKTQSASPAKGPTAPAPPAPTPLDYRGTRRAQRYKMVAGTEVQVDGASAEIIDLSVIGAQILSPSTLRPQQRVRITLADDGGVVRINAAVAWASFEIPKSTPRYRAGIEFTDAQAAAVEAFCKRHQLV